ncbi:MAG TPA: hypothetical protein VFQ62_19175 [Methylomirabilota bacterium]|nr:hypothetical protein [Methylomirabilota bacterium]
MSTVQAQPQFTGTWLLDRAQSQLPHRGGDDRGTSQAQPAEVKLIVEQQGNTLKATRSVMRGSRERAMTETLVVDGSEQTEQTPRGGSSVTRATLGGDRLVVSKTHTQPAREQGQPARTFSRESVWTLSPDGRTLTIDTTMHTPRGERAMKAVYTKAS